MCSKILPTKIGETLSKECRGGKKKKKDAPQKTGPKI
jgi:hypothetical protein